MKNTDESILNKYQMVIGLEVHAQLSTKTKAYSADINEYGSLPNTNISVISLGHPGTLPKVNEKILEFAIKIGLATNCEISRDMHFARKNYFYADLPKGYQITQDTTPICTKGHIVIKDADNSGKTIGITRIHIEEDAGKSIHDQDPFNTLIDLNRAGVPLLEIVSEPDMRSSEEAYNYLFEIRKLVRYLEICDGNMEEGSLRCDANVSVMLKGSKKFGNRAEVKNMNSLRNVQRAIEHEVRRQIEIIENGGSIEQETRSFDAVNGTTFSLRTKENANDYRYFPEPDLQPVSLKEEQINNIREKMPPLPHELFARYTGLGLSAYDASILTENKEFALYFEELIKHTSNYKAAANWMIGDVKSYLNANAVSIDDFSLEPGRLAQLISLIEMGKLSHLVASQMIFKDLVENPDKSAVQIAEEKNIIQESNNDFIEKYAIEAIALYPDKAQAYKAGNKALLGLFMGEVMKLSERKANPKAASEILKKLLEER